MGNPLTGIYYKIEDASWAMLDAMKLGDFFEEHNIPPLILPLAILILVSALLWIFVFSVPGEIVAICGDGVCLEGEELTCPEDCEVLETSNTVKVIVQLSGPAIEGTVEVNILRASDLSKIKSSTVSIMSAEFSNIPKEEIKAEVLCPSGKHRVSRPLTPSEKEVISLTLPDDCFEVIAPDRPSAGQGSISISVIDKNTKESIHGASIHVKRISDDISSASGTTMNGEAVISVPADSMYYLTVSQDGYSSYSGKLQADVFYVGKADLISKRVELSPMISPDAQGELTVCVTSDEGLPMEEGKISVFDSAQDNRKIGSKVLSADGDGCASFTLNAGLLVSASYAPNTASCTASDLSDAVPITDAGESMINLQATCGNVAYIKVIVKDLEGNLLTPDTTVTVWRADTDEKIVGTNEDSSLSVMDDGYTEEVTVPAGVPIYAKASGVPSSFVDTTSAQLEFTAEEHGMIELRLARNSAIGDFTFRGATIFYTPATPNSPIKVYVEQILYNDSIEITDQNGVVEIVIGNEVFPADYRS
jgi:hypothetical protein